MASPSGAGLTDELLKSLRAAGLEPREGVPGLFLRRNEVGGVSYTVVPADGIKLEGETKAKAEAMRDELASLLREKGVEGHGGGCRQLLQPSHVRRREQWLCHAVVADVGAAVCGGRQSDRGGPRRPRRISVLEGHLLGDASSVLLAVPLRSLVGREECSCLAEQ